jgi:hypothetical protein
MLLLAAQAEAADAPHPNLGRSPGGTAHDFQKTNMKRQQTVRIYQITVIPCLL